MWSICRLSAWPCADHRLLDRVRRVFGHRDPCRGGDEHRDPARLPQFQRPGPVAVDEGHLDGGSIRPVGLDKRGQLPVQRHEALREICAFGPAGAVGDMAEAGPEDLDHTPSEAPQSGVDSHDSHDRLPLPS
jgi:hypothetical protein